MYIQPNSTIEIMRGVPLNTRQIDTLYFDAGETEQSAYFNNFVVYSFNKQYYQRVNKNTCRIEVNAENIYNCNYMRFKNEAFGNKWFYAFITNVEYVNHNVSEVTYEIDVMQTWAFDYVLGQSYVEREHSADDILGSHLLPEPVDPGEPYCQAMTQGGFTTMSIVVLTAFDEETGANGDIIDGIYQGADRMVFPCTHDGALDCNDYIDGIMGTTGGADRIVSVYICPTLFASNMGYDPSEFNSEDLGRPRTIAGITPNNNKLLCYPYTFLSVDTLNDSHIYRYEYFQSLEISFKYVGVGVGSPNLIIVPNNYEVNLLPNYTQQITMGGYPQCCFNVDTYKQWLASNGAFNVMSIIGSGAGMIAGVATQNYFLAGASAIGLTSAILHDRIESQRSNTARGSVASDANVANRSKDVYFKVMGLKPEKVRMLDDFFSRYGYACERVKIPNRNVRKRWTYTKTRDCVVKGNVPADDLEKISKIFDGGITFWNSSTGTPGEYVMNDNAPV